MCSGSTVLGFDLAPVGFTESRSSFEGLKKGTRFAGTSTLSPVLGLRPIRALRWRVRKLPKPRISILSPDLSAPMTESKRVSTMISPSRRVRSPSEVTLSTRSALVIRGGPFACGNQIAAMQVSVSIVDADCCLWIVILTTAIFVCMGEMRERSDWLAQFSRFLLGSVDLIELRGNFGYMAGYFHM